MSIEAGKAALEQELAALYSDVAALKSVQTFASRKAQAIYNYAKSGVPMTILTPGSYSPDGSGTQTAGPITATGLGGFDKPSPGMGLSAAQPILTVQLQVVWTHGNHETSAQIFAQKNAQAIHDYYSQAIIQTQDHSLAPLVLPLTGPTIGTGGDLASSPGMGFDAAKPILEAEISRIWSQISNTNVHSLAQFAQEMSTAIHNFCIQGKVDTNGAFAAGMGQAAGTIS